MMKLKKINNLSFFLNFILLFLLITSLGVNQVLTGKINKKLGIKNNFPVLISGIVRSGDSANTAALTGNLVEDAIKLVVSAGVPAVYGAELGVSFDQVQSSINIMKLYDPDYGKQKITLTGDDKQRYIDVAIRISCEYCCGAKSIISSDGKAACGCAHSQAMRGLAAYLIQNHDAEYSNDEILRELARWKGMYFPKQMIKKMTEQLQGGNYTPDTASLILGLDLSDYGQGGEAPLPSEIKDLPSMVGGC